MAKLTDKDLFEFVYRADTPHKICIAERWLRDHQYLTSRSTFDELITILNRTAKNLFKASMKEYEDKIFKNGFEINVVTGEVFARSEGAKI